MTAVEWRRVREFSDSGGLRAAPDAEATAIRYESSVGERALVVPAGEVEVVGRVGEEVTVAFVDPPTPVAARGLLRALGDESVVVALPRGAGGADLVVAGGQVVAAGDVLDLYRLSERGELIPPSPGPERLGEDERSLHGRADWFRRRHGLAD